MKRYEARKWVSDEEREGLAEPPVLSLFQGRAKAVREFIVLCIRRGWIAYGPLTPLAEDGGIRYVPVLIPPSHNKSQL